MGFASVVPPADSGQIYAAIDSMAQVSDVAMMQERVPWAQLLNGVPMETLLAQRASKANALRGLGLSVIYLVDPLNPMNRREEDPALVARGLSLTQPAVRAMYENWVRGIARSVHPEYFGLASEINTLAEGGDPTLYATVRGLVNELAPQVRQLSPSSKVFVSFQADEANGMFGPEPLDEFALIKDFDIDALGLSSYPGFFFSDPSEIPADYFKRFADATNLPLLLVEGGWSSANVPSASGTPEEQVAFLNRFAQLLNGVGAKVWISLTFMDGNWGPDAANFSSMGVMNEALQRKPSYAAWQQIFDRPLAP